ncbi:8532_t:CDS:2, partial [Ambispora leptoticha]
TFRLGFGSPYSSKVLVGFVLSDGLLRTYHSPNGDIRWNRFTSPDENGQISENGEGFFYNNTNNEEATSSISLNILEGGFGYVVVTKSIAPDLQDVLFSQWNVYVSFLKPDSTIPTKPFIMYQTPMPYIRMSILHCAVVFDGTGNECLMLISVNLTSTVFMDTNGTSNYTAGGNNSTSSHLYNTTLANPNQPFNIVSSIRFESQGSVTDIQRLKADQIIHDMTLLPLFYGGYVTLGVINNVTNETGGVMLDRDGNVREQWSYNTFTNHSSGYISNTLWAAKKDSTTARNWTIITKEFPRLKAASTDNFPKDADIRYNNPNIDTTFPTIGAVISSNITQISITYAEPVILSSGNITIYQEGKYGSADIFRQGINRVTIQDKKVTIYVLDSTFNIPNATYYVIVDTNFVRDSNTREALLGLDKESWQFTTEPFKPGRIDKDGQSGLIRLTPEASMTFKSLLKNSSSIYEDVLNELANAIPISRERLEINKKYQIVGDQILLRITILPSKDNSEISIKQVMSNLNTLIAYKDITSISRYNYTNWLDSSFGFQETNNIWEKYKLMIVIAIVAASLIFIVFLMAWRKNKNGRNSVIFTSALILQDIVFDFAFVIFNSKDIPELYIYSLFTLIIPIIMNCASALYVILSENSRNDKFNSWFRKYPQVAAIFTLFASGDVVILHVLDSQVAGLQIFSATFSERAEAIIFITSTLNLFIEDLPQFIIRVCYWQNTIEYDIIPLIALWSSAVVLLNTLI